MADVREEVRALDALRKKARLAYLYLACGLLCALALGTLVAPAFGLCAAALVALLYFGFLRRDIARYRDGYTRARVLLSVQRHIASAEYRKKCPLSLCDVREDGAVPVNNTNGITRHFVEGTWRGESVSLCDISCVYQLPNQGARRRAVPLSGCYVRVGLTRPVDFCAVFCPEDMLPEGEMRACYAEKGLEPVAQSAAETLACFARASDVEVLRAVARAIETAARLTNGRIIVKIAGQRMEAFLPRRYLAQGEPDYKKPLTEDRLEGDVLPELGALLKIAAACAAVTA